jgi:hypothetical protein
MSDSTARLRQLVRQAKALDSLRKFANTTEDAKCEEELKGFWNRVAVAYQDVSKVFEAEGLKVQSLDRDYEPGFSVQDLPGSRFIFWIALAGRKPVALARRKADSNPASHVVSAPQLCSRSSCDLCDVTHTDIVNAITYAYDKSFFGQVHPVKP